MTCPRCGSSRRKKFGYTPKGIARARCLDCTRVYHDVERTRHADSRVEISATANGIEAALALVKAGVFSVAEPVEIWRHARIDRWGCRTDIAPIRIDRPTAGGYRDVCFWLGGRQFWELTHRITWALRYGAVPTGIRVYGARSGELYQLERMARSARAPSEPVYWPYSDSTDDPIVATINRLVPKDLWECFRADVCQELALEMVMSGGSEPSADAVKACVALVRRRNPVLAGYMRSLDAPMRAGDGEHGTRLVDMLSA